MFISNAAQSLRFDLQSGHSKCIAEYIKTNSMSVAKYTIVNPNDPHPFPESHKITVRVTSVESGQFSFQAAEAGDYMTCFWALDHKPQSTITIDFDWKTGVAAKDWTNVAKKGTIDGHEEIQSTILQSSKERIWGSNAKSPAKGTWEWLWEKQGIESWKPFSSKHSFELQLLEELRKQNSSAEVHLSRSDPILRPSPCRHSLRTRCHRLPHRFFHLPPRLVSSNPSSPVLLTTPETSTTTASSSKKIAASFLAPPPPSPFFIAPSPSCAQTDGSAACESSNHIQATCVGLAIWNRTSGMTSVAHMDFPNIVDVGLTQMLTLVVNQNSDAELNLCQ
ncbi:unnamed protein product [Camellia sinensis]